MQIFAIILDLLIIFAFFFGSLIFPVQQRIVYARIAILFILFPQIATFNRLAA
jgi:hypothetical protein